MQCQFYLNFQTNKNFWYVSLKSHGISQHGNKVEFKTKTRHIWKLRFDCNSTELQNAKRLHAPTRILLLLSEMLIKYCL